MTHKKQLPTKVLWMDLEMTGLDPNKDVILEVAAEITDFDFSTLATYEACVKHPKDTVVKRMQANAWWQAYPQNRDFFVQNLSSGKSLTQIEQEIITLVQSHFGNEPAVLGGNSIYNDRLFIKRWMPALDLKLHYRMLDVSSWKIVMQGRYGVDFQKPEAHRAFEDTQGSIAELQHYLDWFHREQRESSKKTP